MPAISRAARRKRGDRGFALYELVLALAIMGLIAGLVLPHLVRPAGPVEIRNAAEEIAALFRSDRNAALSARHDVVSRVDLASGLVRAGSSGRIVEIPRGVRVELVQSSRELAGGDSGIRFLPDGRSSGGVLTLSRNHFSYRVSVNWLTASVRVARVESEG
ncbi:MAG: GspH/FimT family pseudopilin [Propylenella sp.]